MQENRPRIEIFSAGCATCRAMVERVQQLASSTHEVHVHEMQEPTAAYRAGILGIRSVPAIVINGKLADFSGRGPDEAALRAAIHGQAQQAP